MTAMEAAVRTFFSSRQFAVAGASSDPRKFGHKGKHGLCSVQKHHNILDA